MAVFTLKSLRLCSGVVALAGPIWAAEPHLNQASKASSQIARTPAIMASHQHVPPSPGYSAPVPSATTSTPVISSNVTVAPAYSTPVSTPMIADHFGTYSGSPYVTSQVAYSGGYTPYGTPGGYEARVGSPYYYYAPQGQFVTTGDPYYDHFGPGFHRNSLHGHYRFPYYNYRAPWYYPGRAVYNRDTNFAW